MKYLRFFENFDESDTWENIQSSLDVYQLYELLVFKYGEVFKDTKTAIDEYEDDYNPDHIYDVIEWELKALKKWDDFLQNYETYQNEKEEADPFHWKNRKKSYDNLMKSFDDKKLEAIVNWETDNIKDFFKELKSKLDSQVGYGKSISFSDVKEVGDKYDIEVVKYKQFLDELPTQKMKEDAPPSNAPAFGLVNPITHKARIVIGAKSIDSELLNFIYHMLKHENVHVGQKSRKKDKNQGEFLGDVRNTKAYFSNKDEIMAFAQSVSDMIMDRNPKDLQSAINQIERTSLWRPISSLDTKTKQRYKKYIYLYLEKEFEKLGKGKDIPSSHFLINQKVKK